MYSYSIGADHRPSGCSQRANNYVSNSIGKTVQRRRLGAPIPARRGGMGRTLQDLGGFQPTQSERSSVGFFSTEEATALAALLGVLLVVGGLIALIFVAPPVASVILQVATILGALAGIYFLLNVLLASSISAPQQAAGAAVAAARLSYCWSTGQCSRSTERQRRLAVTDDFRGKARQFETDALAWFARRRPTAPDEIGRKSRSFLKDGVLNLYSRVDFLRHRRFPCCAEAWSKWLSLARPGRSVRHVRSRVRSCGWDECQSNIAPSVSGGSDAATLATRSSTKSRATAVAAITAVFRFPATGTIAIAAVARS